MINSSSIFSAEAKYKLILENFFTRHYEKDFLVSHGIDHHRRVWHFAKELIACQEDDPLLADPLFPDKLLIASYLHDIGMSVDPGLKHGHHSRELSVRFLKEQNLKETDYQDVLSAIENHDNKDYDNSTVQDLLQTILSVADDLDAFGETGISRYRETYLERGVKQHLIGTTIRENARKRFENFERLFGKYPELVSKHRKRYLILDNYFKNNYLNTE